MAILIKNTIPHKRIDQFLTAIEHVSIQLEDGVLISAVYAPHYTAHRSYTLILSLAVSPKCCSLAI